jgi:hypothetical protein
MKSFKFVFIFSVIAVFFCSLFFACSDDSVSPANLYISDSLNILWTDYYGNILGGDTTDWCTNFFPPAYPNPISIPDYIRIKFFIPSIDTVTCYILKTFRDTLFIVKDEPLMPGTYECQVDAINIGSGIKRVYIFYKHNNVFNNYCKNYGDIWIK